MSSHSRQNHAPVVHDAFTLLLPGFGPSHTMIGPDVPLQVLPEVAWTISAQPHSITNRAATAPEEIVDWIAPLAL